MSWVSPESRATALRCTVISNLSLVACVFTLKPASKRKKKTHQSDDGKQKSRRPLGTDGSSGQARHVISSLRITASVTASLLRAAAPVPQTASLSRTRLLIAGTERREIYSRRSYTILAKGLKRNDQTAWSMGVPLTFSTAPRFSVRDDVVGSWQQYSSSRAGCVVVSGGGGS